MESYNDRYKLWDEFLEEWPLSRLSEMTLDEYIKTGSQETFTYWIESRLDKLGSIWGGSAFKFGVFSREGSEPKENSKRDSYSSTHGWYTALGDSAEEAFEKVRESVARVAQLARNGDLESIETFTGLGEAYKWKIAFHYQERSSPKIVNVFMPEALAAFVGSDSIKNTAALQKEVLSKNSEELGILEFGKKVWAVWSKKNIPIWKLSHGPAIFSADEQQQLLDERKVLVNSLTGKGQGKNFQEAPIGTLFYLCHGNSIQLLGRLTTATKPLSKDETWLEREYELLFPALKHERYTHNSKYWSPQGNSTFYQVKPRDLPEFEETLLKPFFNKDLLALSELYSQDDLQNLEIVQQEYNDAGDELETDEKRPINCFNRIYYGPPGTGKTYQLLRLLEGYEQKPEAATIEQRKKQFVAVNIASLTWWRAVFCALYDLGGRATVPKLLEHAFVDAVAAQSASKNYRAAVWASLQTHTIEESTTVNYKNRVEPAVFDKADGSVWELAGDWKEICADLVEMVDEYNAISHGKLSQEKIKRYSFVTFHQSYGYEEFVEGLRPVLNDDLEEGQVRYEIRSGVFKLLCEEARQNPTESYAMVIDEVNRGNISKIFGELITLIEPDKRAGASNEVIVKLPYSGQEFSVPANIDIIGTMNTADRSLTLLDTALRRRFEFVPLLADTRDETGAPLVGLIVKTEQGKIDVRQMLARINERIEVLYDRDHTIGHAYFINLKNIDDDERFSQLADIFRKKIVPLLEEYFFEDWAKISLVLGDNQKPEDTSFITKLNVEKDLQTLFGEHELDLYSVKERYQINSDAFDKPEAYIGIYDPQAIQQL